MSLDIGLLFDLFQEAIQIPRNSFYLTRQTVFQGYAPHCNPECKLLPYATELRCLLLPICSVDNDKQKILLAQLLNTKDISLIYLEKEGYIEYYITYELDPGLYFFAEVEGWSMFKCRNGISFEESLRKGIDCVI